MKKKKKSFRDFDQTRKRKEGDNIPIGSLMFKIIAGATLW